MFELKILDKTYGFLGYIPKTAKAKLFHNLALLIPIGLGLSAALIAQLLGVDLPKNFLNYVSLPSLALMFFAYEKEFILKLRKFKWHWLPYAFWVLIITMCYIDMSVSRISIWIYVAVFFIFNGFMEWLQERIEDDPELTPKHSE